MRRTRIGGDFLRTNTSAPPAHDARYPGVDADHQQVVIRDDRYVELVDPKTGKTLANDKRK